MIRSRTLPGALLVACGIFLVAPAVLAQLPKQVERCLPYPTYAQEVETIYSEPRMKPAAEKKIVIDSVDFDGPITLPMADQQKVVDDLKKLEIDDRPDWTDEVLEVTVRGAWQDAGYFKAHVHGTSRVVGSDALKPHVALTVKVDEGLQYFQGQLTFRSADPDVPLLFTPAELSKLYPLRAGDVFDADKIRSSLDRYRKLYAARGYIDFSAVPEFEVNDATRTIDLTLEFDQQRQFRMDAIVVDGLDPRTERILRDTIKPGAVFNYDILQKFMDENRSALPPDASIAENVHLKKNVSTGTVSMRFDFFNCPNSAN